MRRIPHLITALGMLVLSNIAQAQDYLDILDLNYTYAAPANDTSATTTFGSANLFVPIVINKEKGNAITIGANANSFKVDAADGQDYDFYNLTLPVGLHYNFSPKFAGDFTTLHRINSDFDPLSASDYQFGMLNTFSYKKSDSLTIKFGVYYNGELSGPLFVPLFGVNWKVNDKLQIYGVLPRDATLFYRQSDRLAFGASFRGQIATYRMHNEGTDSYIQRAKNEMALFTDVYLTKSIVIQAKAGYLLGTNYKEYNSGDKVDWALSLVRFGDNRTELNKLGGDGAFGKISLIYRFDLSKL